MAVYVVSDIHGHYDLFLKGLSEIQFSEEDYLWCIGDMIDRGPDGIKILQSIMQHKNIDLIIGNHEFMMINSVDPYGEKKCWGPDSTLWLDMNGGRSTYHEYANLSKRDRENLLIWLNNRYITKTINVNETEFCMTHSYYKESLNNKTYMEASYSEVWSVVWQSPYREDAETHADDIYSHYDKTFITGHVPVQQIIRRHEGAVEYNSFEAYKKGNLICIDGGCAYGKQPKIENGAIFLRLEDMKEFRVPLK